MKIIVIAMRKGGTGKSTNTRNIAVALVSMGYKVLLIDTDSQGSLTSWWKLRKAKCPELLVVPHDQIAAALSKAEEVGYDFVVIDTAPEANSVTKVIAEHGDFILIPMKAGSDDLRAVGHTLSLVKELKKPYAFVLNEIKPAARITRDIAEAVSHFGPLAPSQVSRAIHVVTPVTGETCIDLGTKSKASQEVLALTNYLLHRLESRHD